MHVTVAFDRASERSVKRAATAIVVIGLFMVVMVAASVQGTPVIIPPDLAPAAGEPFEVPAPTSSPSPTPTPPPEPRSEIVEAVISLVFVLMGIAALAVIVLFIVRALMRMWRERPLRAREGGDVEFEETSSGITQEADATAPAIRRGIAGALRSIDERAVADDAIIAAWVGLEESAADAGITRGRSETPAEFALRIITRRAGITDAATALLALYERVRFGGYVSQESDRDEARAALTTIEEGWR